MKSADLKGKIMTVACSLAAGVLNGFLGGGGGVIVVTLLLSQFQLTQRKAQATALLVILPLTVVSAVVYIVLGQVEWLETLYITIGVVLGGVAGAFLLNKLNDRAVKFVFSVILIFGGVKMLFFSR